jgi:hypothetical protein
MGEVMTQRKVVDVRDNVLVDYDATYLLCRDVKHAWDIEGYWRERGGQVRRKLHCLRCETTRTDVWTAKGGRLRNQYVYPEGYRLAGGIDLKSVRVEELRRVKVYDDEQALIESLFAS